MVPGERILQLTRPRLANFPAPVSADNRFETALQALVARGVRENEARRVLLQRRSGTAERHGPDRMVR